MPLPAYFKWTLLERASGLHFTAPPPADVYRPEFLRSPDPMEVLAAVLAHAQRGRFDVFEPLLTVLRQTDEADVWNSGTKLLAYAAPHSVLRTIFRTFADDVYVRRDGPVQELLSGMLSGAKALWAVPPILDILPLVADRNEYGSMPIDLSFLLEPERGPVFHGPKNVPQPPAGPVESLAWLADDGPVVYDDDGYRALVNGMYDAITAQLQAVPESRRAVFEGELVSIDRVAHRLLARLRADQDSAAVEFGRMTFEAWTGVDCSAFYELHGRLQPLAAAAIVEDFLESGDADKFEPGVRYFFGHRIPD